MNTKLNLDKSLKVILDNKISKTIGPLQKLKIYFSKIFIACPKNIESIQYSACLAITDIIRMTFSENFNQDLGYYYYYYYYYCCCYYYIF